jgi:hypothetical protein
VDTVLGLLGMAVYMAATVGLACGVTMIIVKLSPSQSAKELEARKQKPSG